MLVPTVAFFWPLLKDICDFSAVTARGLQKSATEGLNLFCWCEWGCALYFVLQDRNDNLIFDYWYWIKEINNGYPGSIRKDLAQACRSGWLPQTRAGSLQKGYPLHQSYKKIKKACPWKPFHPFKSWFFRRISQSMPFGFPKNTRHAQRSHFG